MKINIITFGKSKDVNLDKTINEFYKKISHFINIHEINIDNELIKNENNNSEIEKALLNESKKLEKYFSNNSFNIVLAIEGKQMDSIEFSNKINNILCDSQYKQINFIIGSSFGIHHSIKEKANILISFGKMTFNHKIFKLMLLEQIYRSFTIIKNINYHK